MQRPIERHTCTSAAVAAKKDSTKAPSCSKIGSGKLWRDRPAKGHIGRGTDQTAFKGRLGAFYVRFYSAISDASQDHGKGLHRRKDRKRRQHDGDTLSVMRDRFTERPSQKYSTASRATPIQNGGLPVSNGSDRGYSTANRDKRGLPRVDQQDQSQPYSEPSTTSASSLISMYDPTAATRLQKRPPSQPAPRPSQTPHPLIFTDPAKSEGAAVSITSTFLRHDNLGRDLQKVLNQKLRAYDRKGEDWASKSAQSEEVELLRNTLKYINSSPVSQSAQASKSIFAQGSNPETTPVTDFQRRRYEPPFPRYTSTAPPFALNKALHTLLTRRPVAHSVIAKVCYNLLTSASAPDTHTYNMLIRNLVLLRQNSLAQLVFEEMIAAGDTPDEYTIVALLELMVKSGDFPGWKRVAQIQKREEKGWQEVKGRVRSKQLMETLIIHSARFGDRNLIRRYTRSLRNYWPQDPEPGKNVLTALIRFYFEKKEWKNGRYCWWKLLELDAERAKKGIEGEAQGEEVLDQHAWYWWLKHCMLHGPRPTVGRWITIAQDRGIDVDRLLASGPNKTRGLHVRESNKTPLLTQHAAGGDWWQERVQNDLRSATRASRPTPSHESQITDSEKRKILGDTMYGKLYGPSDGDIPSQDFHTPITMPTLRSEQAESNLIFPHDNEQHQQQKRPQLAGNLMPLHQEQNQKHQEQEQTYNPFQQQHQYQHQQKEHLNPSISGNEKSRIWQDLMVRRMGLLLDQHEAQETKASEGKILVTQAEKRRKEILTQWKSGEGGDYYDEEDLTEEERERGQGTESSTRAETNISRVKILQGYSKPARRVYYRPKGRR